MTRYQCNFQGHCEVSPNGSYDSLEECEVNCTSQPDRDLAYLIYQYLPADASQLAPSDQRAIVRSLTGVTLPNPTPFLIALEELNYPELSRIPELVDFIAEHIELWTTYRLLAEPQLSIDMLWELISREILFPLTRTDLDHVAKHIVLSHDPELIIAALETRFQVAIRSKLKQESYYTSFPELENWLLRDSDLSLQLVEGYIHRGDLSYPLRIWNEGELSDRFVLVYNLTKGVTWNTSVSMVGRDPIRIFRDFLRQLPNPLTVVLYDLGDRPTLISKILDLVPVTQEMVDEVAPKLPQDLALFRAAGFQV